MMLCKNLHDSVEMISEICLDWLCVKDPKTVPVCYISEICHNDKESLETVSRDLPD